MNNRYLKSAIISSSIAVITGVLLFGINATFGAPTYQPPGADVKPTFNGMTVTGLIDAIGGITNSKNLPVLISAPFGVDVRGNIQNNAVDGKVIINDPLDVIGTLSVDNIYSSFKGSIDVSDAINILQNALFKKDIDAQGVIKNSTANNSGNVKIDDNLSVAGDSTVTGNADFKGTIRNSTAGIPVDINDLEGLKISSGNLDLQSGAIKNTTGTNPVKIDDSLDVTGLISNSTGGSVEIQNDLKADKGLSVNDTLTVNPDATVDKPITLNGTTFIKYALNVSGAISTNTIKSYSGGTISVNDNLSVTGKVKATGGFGTYSPESNATAYSVANAGFASKSYACSAGGIAVSCFVNSYSADPGASIYTNESGDMQVSGLYIYNGTCWANFKNNSGSIKYFKVGAVCYNPNL